jgi:hypothetical protein
MVFADIFSAGKLTFATGGSGSIPGIDRIRHPANSGLSICQKDCSKAAVHPRLQNARVKNVIHELWRAQRMIEYIRLVSHLGKDEWTKRKRSANQFRANLSAKHDPQRPSMCPLRLINRHR